MLGHQPYAFSRDFDETHEELMSHKTPKDKIRVRELYALGLNGLNLPSGVVDAIGENIETTPEMEMEKMREERSRKIMKERTEREASWTEEDKMIKRKIIENILKSSNNSMV